MFMVEKALEGSRRYWLWIGVLLAFILAGFVAYLHEQEVGLAVTGLSRDVPWGLYIAQFVFCVGLGASALVVVLPYYLHNWKAFAKITVLGEILGMVSVFMAMVFIFVSMGRPMRLINVILYPHPRSLIFWDLFVLSSYVLINAAITITLVSAEHEQVTPPMWIRSLVLLSLPWAVGIHTVTAFLFSGLAGRSFWMTPVLAPRFLVSAFTSGPALLIVLLLVLRRLKVFDASADAISKLTWFVTYCMLINVFFVLMEVFTVFYSGIPEHKEHFEFLFAGLDGNYHMVPWMCLSALLALTSLVVLLVPKYRVQPALLLVACGSAFFSLWLDKGLGLIVGGFTPTPLGALTHYTPTIPEWEVVLGIWALGALLITVLYKITLSVRESANG
jgi:Ni/Fe-hydrogenase subunit HybB-like protein